MTSQSLHRPETEFARRRKMVDPNPRWHTENIVDLDIVMPTRSTPQYDDPNTTAKIQAILAMDLNDPVKELPKSSSAKNRENQFFSVNDGSSKSKSRRKKGKVKREETSRKHSSRPTTAM